MIDIGNEISYLGETAVKLLWEMACDKSQIAKQRADLLKWFAEMHYGKPSSRAGEDMSGQNDAVLEGEWSDYAK